MYTIEHEINDVNLSQDGCVEREDGLVMILSEASVIVQLVSEEQTENRSRNTERVRSG